MPTNVQTAYNQWAHSYDSMENKTRDLDKISSQKMLAGLSYASVLEFGCGTGKNTEWLAQHAVQLTAVDFSEEMIEKAKEKINLPHVQFAQADISQPWPFRTGTYDLVTCNLILEHIQDLFPVFSEAARILKSGGHFFVSELHPGKQYLGSKAKFEVNNEVHSPDCFVHHVSDYFNAAVQNGFECIQLQEWFDEGANIIVPRLICFLFRKR